MRPVLAEAFVEIGHRHIQRLCDTIQLPRGKAIDALLELMNLLVGRADHFTELILGKTERNAAFANATPYKDIDHCRFLSHHHRHSPWLRVWVGRMRLPLG